MLGNPAVYNPHDVDGLKMDFPAGRLHAQERALMRSVICLEGRDEIVVGDLPMDFGTEIGKRPAERMVKDAHAVFVGATVRLWGVVDEIVGEKLLEQIEIPAALNFFRIAADDSHRGFRR
jgi:hypothetical protein